MNYYCLLNFVGFIWRLQWYRAKIIDTCSWVTRKWYRTENFFNWIIFKELFHEIFLDAGKFLESSWDFNTWFITFAKARVISLSLNAAPIIDALAKSTGFTFFGWTIIGFPRILWLGVSFKLFRKFQHKRLHFFDIICPSFDPHTAQKMKFSIKDFLRKCDQICRKLRIWSHLLKKSLMENFIFLCSDIKPGLCLLFLWQDL